MQGIADSFQKGLLLFCAVSVNVLCRFILFSCFRGRSPPEIRVSGLRATPALPPPERELAPERPPLLTEGATPGGVKVAS